LAKKAGKQVEFTMTGEDTELDKSVVDKISDPLVHMIRNSVDHGLESSAEERAQAGKRATGQISLRAFHKGGSIHIEVEDDGRGLNKKAIMAKAKDRGLVHEGDVLNDHAIYNLIFEPGLSTAKTITDVSGRGVGMDVVKRNIESLRGQIEIASEEGKGTIFSIRLPLTMAIIDGMVVSVGAEKYIIPTLSIVTSIRPRRGQISTVVGRGEVLSLQGQLLPLFRLAHLFSIRQGVQNLSEGIIIVVEDDGRRAGFLVDSILGQQQTVIKSLGDAMQGITGIAGGAIMPDGNVGLILDVSGMMKLAKEEPTEHHEVSREHQSTSGPEENHVEVNTYDSEPMSLIETASVA
jgi:two-component system chemotaxis sensor kinase CheA